MHPQWNVFFPTAAQFVLVGAFERCRLSAWFCRRQGYLCTKWREAVPACAPCLPPSPHSLQLSIGSSCRFSPSSAAPCHPESRPCPPVLPHHVQTQWCSKRWTPPGQSGVCGWWRQWPAAGDGQVWALQVANTADGIFVAEASFHLQLKRCGRSAGVGCGRCWSLHNSWLLLSDRLVAPG